MHPVAIPQFAADTSDLDSVTHCIIPSGRQSLNNVTKLLRKAIKRINIDRINRAYGLAQTVPAEKYLAKNHPNFGGTCTAYVPVSISERSSARTKKHFTLYGRFFRIFSEGVFGAL